MRTSDADILILPGYGNAQEDHWQSRWEAKLKTARRVEVPDWHRINRAEWEEALVTAVQAATRPVVIIAHSLGVFVTVHAAPRLAGKVAGAYLVSPSDLDNAEVLAEVDRDYPAVPMDKLPFPAVVVASSNDPHVSLERAKELAAAWGAEFVEAGEAGHINAESGHGPWPEGLMRFAGFMSKLEAPVPLQ